MHQRLQQQITEHEHENPTGVSEALRQVISETYTDYDTQLLASAQRERDRDEFFSVASHELRTPLTAIKGNASMLLEYYGEKIVDEDMRQMVTDIFLSSDRLILIVNDFLDVSRLEQGRMTFRKESFTLCPIVEETRKELDELAAEKHLHITFSPATEECLPVYADPARTKQVLMNLLGNAINYTSHGEVTVHASHSGEFMKVRVTDTGIGISEEQRPLIFRKFQQGEGGTSAARNKTSTGLGLYISKLIIEGMGGSIALEESVLGVGSTFSFTLPLANEGGPGSSSNDAQSNT